MSQFQFKQFTIYQDKTAMKVGTDGVLLGAWVSDKLVGNRLLDIGTGTGVIALMLAQKHPNAKIDAIERDEHAALQAGENVARSSWFNRVTIHHILLQNFIEDCRDLYTDLVCNPPYFIKGWNVDALSRKHARDAASLPHEELILAANKLLNSDGKLHLILPITEAAIFYDAAIHAGLFCANKTVVHTKIGLPTKRWLMSFSKQPCNMVSDVLCIADTNNVYTPEYKLLTGDFYLSF
jgi:tRNA1Val (adenine37-N6)-methyltransferase